MAARDGLFVNIPRNSHFSRGVTPNSWFLLHNLSFITPTPSIWYAGRRSSGASVVRNLRFGTRVLQSGGTCSVSGAGRASRGARRGICLVISSGVTDANFRLDAGLICIQRRYLWSLITLFSIQDLALAMRRATRKGTVSKMM